MSRFATAPLFLFALAGPLPASADETAPPSEARVRFDRGVELFATGNFAAAHGEFHRAYRIQPHPSLLVNLANCELRLGRPADAAKHFEQFLRESPSAPPGQLREVQEALETARREVATVSFLVNPPGATIMIDREPMGQVTEGVSLYVAPGRHLVRAFLPGHESAERVVELTAGERSEVVLTLTPEEYARGHLHVVVHRSTGNPIRLDGHALGRAPWRGQVPAGQHSLEVETERGEWSGHVEVPPARNLEVEIDVPAEAVDDRGPYLWFGGVLTAGLAAGAAVTGVLALRSESDFEGYAGRIERVDYDGDDERARLQRDGNRAADRAEIFSVVTDVLIVGGLASGLATLGYLYLAEPDPPTPRAQMRVARGESGTWVALSVSGSLE